MNTHTRHRLHFRSSTNSRAPLGIFVLILASLAVLSLAGCTGLTSARSSAAKSGSTLAITAQPVSQSVVVGQTATFSIVAAGTGTLTYQWKKSGTVISGATAASYATTATKNSDNGAQFSVVVTDGSGSLASNSATLTVTAS